MIFSKEKYRSRSVRRQPPPPPILPTHPPPCGFLSISFCLLCTRCRNDFHSC